jgi:hypothetical protein
MTTTPTGLPRTVCALTLGGIVSAVFLYATLTAWDRFLFVPSLYDPGLRSIMGMGKILLVWLGGLIFGTIAGRIAPGSGTHQLAFCCVAVCYWLYPYSFLEGSFFPILPLAGTLIVLSGVYFGHKLVRWRETD